MKLERRVGGVFGGLKRSENGGFNNWNIRYDLIKKNGKGSKKAQKKLLKKIFQTKR